MVEPHRHCVICGKTIPSEERFCSEECENDYRDRVKKQKRYIYLLMAFPIILIVLLFIFGGGI